MPRTNIAKLALFASMCCVSSAWADRFESAIGLPSPQTHITFDEIILASGAAVTTQYSALGVSFSGLYYNPSNANLNEGIPGLNGKRLANFNPLTNPFSISFLTPVTDGVVGMSSGGTGSRFTALFRGSVVDSFQDSTPVQTKGFFGFTGIVFDELQIQGGGYSGFSLLDNVQFTQVPEPASAILSFLGLLAIASKSRITRRCT